MKARLLYLAGASLMVTLALNACTNKQENNPAVGGPKGPVPVRIATVAEQTMPVQLTNFGTAEAYTTIMVRAQVSGELTRVWFNEGDVVEKDQILFTIDPRPYDVALRQAEANLAKSVAQSEQARATLSKDSIQANNARVELERDEPLLAKGMVSKEEYDPVRTNADALTAAVAADAATVKSAEEGIRSAKVAIDDAKLQLGYCTIRSPIKGKTGSLLIQQGNLVRANDTMSMVVIAQTMPIYVTFTLPEKNLSIVKERMAHEPLDVTALIPQEEDRPVPGKLTFIDNTVTAGTIRLKATFSNEDNRLWPGQFVNVVLQVAVQSDAIVAPSQAIQRGQSGFYAYVVKPDMTVELRNLVLGDSQGDLTIVKEGLQPEEKVVTDGQLRLTPDATVSILSEPTAGGEQKS